MTESLVSSVDGNYYVVPRGIGPIEPREITESQKEFLGIYAEKLPLQHHQTKELFINPMPADKGVGDLATKKLAIIK